MTALGSSRTTRKPSSGIDQPLFTAAEHPRRANINQLSERNSPMKTFVALCLAMLLMLAASLELSALAQTRVRSHARRNGTIAQSVRPTARCRDGSYSYSAHRRGTCSHHGGVAIWNPRN